MRFRCGPHFYQLRITPGPLAHEGTPCLGACLQSTREILLSAACPPADRLRTLIRELAIAWVFECGEPTDWLDRVATIAIATYADLNRQGGELAVLSLRAGESTGDAASAIGLSRSRECAVCRTAVAGGSVACRPGMPGTVDLALFCDFCGRTQRWREASSARGLPSGVVLGEMIFERGDTTGITSRCEA